MADSRFPSVEAPIATALSRLWRRRILFLGSVATMLIAATLAIFAITPRYTAQSLIMLDPREQRVVNIEAVLSRLSTDDPAVQSEIEVLRSEDLARRVIAKTDLVRFPEFNPALSTALVERVLAMAEWPWVDAAFGDLVAAPNSLEANTRNTAAAVDAYFDRLTVEALGRNSRVIGIEFMSKQPALAARVANALADTYIALQTEAKLTATDEAAKWLEQRLAKVGEELMASERAIAASRASIVAAGGWDPALFEQQIAQINGELMRARARHEEAQSELAQIRGSVAVYGTAAVFEVVDPQLMISTNEQLMWLRRTEAELRARLGADDPAVGELRDDIRRLIDQTAQRLIAGARNQVEIADSTVRALETQLRGLVEESVTFGRPQAELRALQREAEATAGLYETLLARSKETSQGLLEQADARIISRASVPHETSFPNRIMLLGVALVGSIAIGGCLVGFADALERGYRSGDQLKRDLSAPMLAEIPMAGRRTEPRALSELLVNEPASAYAEALRTLATSIELAERLPKSGKVLLITSSLPREGKTTLTTSLAITLTGLGRRVLVVDCDLRHPAAHVHFGLRRSPGLSSCLSGQVKATDAIQHHAGSAVDLIAAGDVTEASSLQLLRSERLHRLLQDLRGNYDVILLDSPPLLPIADTRLIGGLADACIMIVRWRLTEQTAARRAFEQLNQAGCKILGLVLNQLRDKAEYGYGSYYASYRAAYESRQAPEARRTEQET